MPTDLYLSPKDEDGPLGCESNADNASTYGPAWSTQDNEVDSALDDPGARGALGPYENSATGWPYTNLLKLILLGLAGL